MPADTAPKEAILFVHGFGSSAKAWKPLLALLRQDERMTARYEFHTWEYPTKWVELNLFGRIPRLKELGKALRDKIDSPGLRDRPLTLVGHSQGGLVIQSFFATQLESGMAPTLKSIRQAIFLATPSQGSTTGMNLRLLFSTLFNNPQETTLRVLNPDVADLRNVVRERIVAATKDTDNTWRIPIHAFSGLEDNIVPEASARGPFDSVKRVKGNHFSIIKPANHQDERYAQLAELLLNPGGHSQRFEIASYRTEIRVEPRADEQIITESEKNPRTVAFDNFGTIKRTVRFANANQCNNPFTIRYATRSEGYVEGETTHTNEVPPAEAGRWADTGTYYQFDFTPRPNEDFALNLKIYGGFAPGERDAHFHLLAHSHYREMFYQLDLSAYVEAGFQIQPAPILYFYPEDVEHGELCKRRFPENAIEPQSTDANGHYSWYLQDIYQGVVDIVWDIAQP